MPRGGKNIQQDIFVKNSQKFTKKKGYQSCKTGSYLQIPNNLLKFLQKIPEI